MTEHWTLSEHYPTIIETKSIQHGKIEINDEDTEKFHALKVNFETNKDFELSPIKLNIQTTKTIFVVANLPFVKEI